MQKKYPCAKNNRFNWQGGLDCNYKTNVAFLKSQNKNFQVALFRVTKHLFLTI